MNVERGTLEGEDTPEHAAEWDARIEAAVAAAKADPRYAHLFTPEHSAASLMQAEADIAAGRVYSNEDVIVWLKTWGTPDWKPLRRQWTK